MSASSEKARKLDAAETSLVPVYMMRRGG